MAAKKKKVKAGKSAVKKKAKAKPGKIRSVKRKKAVKIKVSKTKHAAPKLKAVKEKGTLIGKVSHYFPRVKAGAIIVESGAGLAVGDTIRIKGHTTDFRQNIASMQIDRSPIEKASKGQEIGILVKSRVRIHDKVYRI